MSRPVTSEEFRLGVSRIIAALEKLEKRPELRTERKKQTIPGTTQIDVERVLENPAEEFQAQFAAILSSAFLLVIALVWKDFFAQLFEKIEPEKRLGYYLVFAVIMSVFFGFLIYLTIRYISPEGRKQNLLGAEWEEALSYGDDEVQVQTTPTVTNGVAEAS